MSLVPRAISVVIVGPMGDEKTSLGHVPINKHLDNIAAAVEECGRRLEASGTPLGLRAVSAEKNKAGPIGNFVLLNIDQADLAIADISMRTPSVFYELALLHALGRPTILIDYKSQLADLPFYVKDQRVLGVEDFTVEELTAVLLESLSAHQVGSGLPTYWTNAITNFYTVPLVDASAVNGLATGYFYNFARWMIADGHGVLARMQKARFRYGQNFTHLAIIRPNSIQQLDETRKIVERIPGFYRGRKYKDPDFPRDFTFNTVGPYIIDYPTPLESLSVSPSYKKVKDLLLAYFQRDGSLIAKMEGRFIATYFDTIVRLAQETPGSNANRLKFMTPQEIADVVAS